MERITSADNATLKFGRKLLRSARERTQSGKILLDGVHLVAAYKARFGLSNNILFVDERAVGSPEIATLLQALPTDSRVLLVEPHLLATLSPVRTPTGIVALCDRPVVKAKDQQDPFHLLLDGIQDPGNLGSILRTAAATGVDRVILTETCTDAWSPKCLRGGMGAQFAVPIETVVEPVSVISRFQGKTISTSPAGRIPLMQAELRGSLLAAFGGEGAGLAPELAASTHMSIRVTLQNDIESLNVGAAVAMFCYERSRQEEPWVAESGQGN